MKGFVKVTLQPTGQSVYVPAGETVLEAAREAGLELHTPCGGHGTCGSCRIVFETAAPEPTAEEASHLTAGELASGVRLACRARLAEDARITIPETTLRKDSKFLLHGITRETRLAPSVEKVLVRVPEPTLEYQHADADRLLAAIEGRDLTICPKALESLSPSLRTAGNEVTVLIDSGEILVVEPGDTTGSLYAAAFDIGTTTVVGMLLDLSTGAEIAVAARTNPQVSHGDDVVSRISFASDGGLGKLQSAVVSCINEILEEIAAAASVTTSQIYQVVLCGNTTMNHLFLGVDPTFVAQSPYVAAVRSHVVTRPCFIPLSMNPAGRIVTLPNVAGFVGGDTVAVMLAADFAHSKKLRLAVDIGTNGEIVLGAAGRLFCASAAAGPAFEGARIRHGMRAAAGAIESVSVEDSRLVLSTINDAPPVGLCGTGLIDTVAVLVTAGLIDTTGRLLSAAEAENAPEDLRRRLVENSSGPVFVVADAKTDGAKRDVHLSQRDVRELQLAKAAIRAGIEILMKEYGVSAADLDEVLLAGAFGNYISKESALRIGLLPDVPAEKITQIGNAAGTGSKLCAIDRDLVVEAEELSLSTDYVELAGRADFQTIFVESMFF